MQDFSFHTHTNTFNIYDGHNSIEEMITKAEQIGFTKLGISNHMIFHPNMPNQHQMFFSDLGKACDVYKRTIEEIRTVSLKHKISVKAGFEVDFFPSSQWRKSFEKMREEIKADYYIGATHFLRNESEQYMMNFYYMRRTPNIRIHEEDLTLYLKNYWNNVIEAIKSGYFNFMAHLDVCKIFGYCITPEWDDYKWKTIETLYKYKQPYELNTSGWNKCNEQHPHTWMIKELAEKGVPVIISDDAHSTEMLGQHFDKAENLLESIKYTSRYNPNF